MAAPAASNGSRAGVTATLRTRLLLGLNLLVLAAFVAAVQHWWGWGRLFAPWRVLDPLDVALAVAGLLLSYGLRALRIYWAERDIPRGRMVSCLRLVLLNNSFNLLLPMRSGEASFPLLMRRWFGVDLGRATGILVWLRLLDLHVLAAIGVICAARGWLSADQGLDDLALVLAAVAVAAPPLLFAGRRGLARRLAGRRGRVSGLLHRLLAGLPEHPSGLLRDLLMTWCGWGVKLAALGWVLSHLAHLPSALGVLGAIGGDLSTVLPIHSPGGFGTYEAGVLALLAPARAPTPELLAAAVNLHLLVLTTALASGALAWLAGGLGARPMVESATKSDE
jgi:Uncharacterised protein family (UPF0104).